jgi:hypothetical protein
MRLSFVPLGVVMLALAGCGDESPDGSTLSTTGSSGPGGAAGAGGHLASGSGAGGTGGQGVGGSECAVNELPLLITIEDGVADSQAVPVRYEGQDGWLGVDTGSPTTFVFGKEGDPEYVARAGSIELGCEVRPVASRTFDAIGVELLEGKPVLGVLGIDFFREYPSELDYPGRRVQRFLAGGGPDGVDALAPMPFTFHDPRIVLDVALDATPVRLIYDTGAHDTIWVGVDGQPGDREVVLGSADGETISAFYGSAELTMTTDRPTDIRVLRAPEWPYLAEELREFDIDGLLGATGIGFRRVVFDFASSRLLLGPRLEAE